MKLKTKGEKNTGHGGSRKGAGRKPSGNEAKKVYSFTLPPDLVAAIEAEAEAAGVSRSEYVAKALRDRLQVPD